MNLLIEGDSKSGKVLSKIRFAFWRVIHSNSVRVRCTALGTNLIHKKIEYHHFHTSGSLCQKVAKFVMFFLTGPAIIIFFYSQVGLLRAFNQGHLNSMWGGCRAIKNPSTITDLG